MHLLALSCTYVYTKVCMYSSYFAITGASSVCRFRIVAHMSLQSFSLVDVSHASLKFLWIFFVFFSAKNRVPYLGVLIIRTLLFRVLRSPVFGNPQMAHSLPLFEAPPRPHGRATPPAQTDRLPGGPAGGA